MHTRTLSRMRLLLSLALAAAGLAALLLPTQQANAAVTGTRTVLVILTEWTERPRDAVTQASAADVINTSVNNWYREVSDGQLGFTGTSTPWLTLPAGSNPCSNPAGYRTAAEAAATAAGYNLASYQHILMYSTHTGCPNSGTLNGASLWILGGSLTLRVVAHELGHNLGLQHADWLNCKTPTGTPVPFATSGCTSEPQGDFLDNMGGALSNSTPQFGAINQNKLGWLVGGRKKNVGVGVTTHTIKPIEKVGIALQVLKVTAGGRDWWIEYRQPIGADAFLAAWPGATNGVIVRTPGNYTAPYAGTWLLDMTPGTSAIQAALPAGKSWTDPSNKLTITVTSVTAANATLTVKVTA